MKEEKFTDFLRRDDVMLLMTTSPAGLGHIRVTEALLEGIPEGVRAEILGIEDGGIQFIHRLTSRNRAMRRLFEFVQNTPNFEDLFTKLYTRGLRKDTKKLFLMISDLVSRRRPKPEVLMIISTHFGLAHKISEIKLKLAKELNLCVILCQVVTDDSPQKIWAVRNEDYIFVPSEYTKENLLKYMPDNYPSANIVVSPYPISPRFSKLLRPGDLAERKEQLKPDGDKQVKVMVPVSGAAVHLKYFEDLLSYLDRKKVFQITLVSRDSRYTKNFLRWCQEKPSLEVIADIPDRDVVLSYEKELLKNIYSLEITKPSEQAFKALASPRRRGGVILLFSEPVGRQERDNLNYLERLGIIPSKEDQIKLNRLYYANERQDLDSEFLHKARNWRGLILPTDGRIAGRAIVRLKDTGILYSMAQFKGFAKSSKVNANGVKIFWRKLAKHTKNQCSFLF